MQLSTNHHQAAKSTTQKRVYSKYWKLSLGYFSELLAFSYTSHKIHTLKKKQAPVETDKNESFLWN